MATNPIYIAPQSPGRSKNRSVTTPPSPTASASPSFSSLLCSDSSQSRSLEAAFSPPPAARPLSVSVQSTQRSPSLQQRFSSPQLSHAPQRPHLFTNISIVTLHKNRELRVLERKHLFSYPIDGHAKSFLKEIGYMCFPEKQLDQTPYQSDSCYTFQMVDEHCSTFQIYCRRLVSTHVPDDLVCVCISSFFPYVSFYSNILRQLESLFMDCAKKAKPLESFCKKSLHFSQILYRQPLPYAGEFCTFHLKAMNEVKILREEEFPTIILENELSCIVSSLKLPQLLSLFSAMLFEQRVIIYSADLSNLPRICYALSSIIFPFQWKYSIIPVLHRHMLEFCLSKDPFIIGVQSSLKNSIDKLGLKNVHSVDIDKDKLEEPDVLYEKFPRLPFQSLCFALSKLLKRTSVHTNDDIRAPFIQFFVSIFGPYRRYIRFVDSARRFLDVQAFVHGSEDSKEFLELMSTTKHFQELMNAKQTVINTTTAESYKEDAFEKAVSSLGIYPPLVERRELTIFSSLRERLKNMRYGRMMVEKPNSMELDSPSSMRIETPSRRPSVTSLSRLSHTTPFMSLHISFAPPLHFVPELRDTSVPPSPFDTPVLSPNSISRSGSRSSRSDSFLKSSYSTLLNDNDLTPRELPHQSPLPEKNDQVLHLSPITTVGAKLGNTPPHLNLPLLNELDLDWSIPQENGIN